MLCYLSGISTTAQQLVVVRLVGVDNFPKAMSVIEMATVPASMAAGPFSGMYAPSILCMFTARVQTRIYHTSGGAPSSSFKRIVSV